MDVPGAVPQLHRSRADQTPGSQPAHRLHWQYIYFSKQSLSLLFTFLSHDIFSENPLFLQNIRNLLLCEDSIGFLGWCIRRKQLLSIGEELPGAIPAQHRNETFAFFIVGRDKTVLIERPLNDPEFCTTRGYTIHLKLHIKLIAPEEGDRREGLLLAQDVPRDGLTLFGRIHPMFQAHLSSEMRMVPVSDISSRIDVRGSFAESIANNAVL